MLMHVPGSMSEDVKKSLYDYILSAFQGTWMVNISDSLVQDKYWDMREYFAQLR